MEFLVTFNVLYLKKTIHILIKINAILTSVVLYNIDCNVLLNLELTE